MNTGVKAGAVVLGWVMGLSTAWAQGSLTPPGAPAPTMKSLSQVEPRTPITSAPYTISAPGSYYLTTNLTSTGHGVIIATNGVTLDLMGFTLTGNRGSGDCGVLLNGATNAPIYDVVVRNGIMRNFGNGVHAAYSKRSRFEQLIAASNVYYGVWLNGKSGQCGGNTIANCTISGNASYGVYLNGYSGQCNGNTIAHCTVSGNASYGVWLDGYLGQCNGNTITDCTVSDNADYGVEFYGGSGQCNGNSIASCTISDNANDGIYMYYANGNRVEGNHVTGQTGSPTYGIYCAGTANNLIVRNTCVGQTTNFVMNANDTYGPVVTSSGALATTNGAAALSPWANFSR